MTSSIGGEPPNRSTASDLRDVGLALAATLRIASEEEQEWEPRFPDVPFPEDYVALISQTGPGTLGGTLRLLAPGCDDGSGRFDGFDLETEQQRHRAPDEGEEARLWGVFSSGETCWWLPIHPDPARWLLVLVGAGHQQLNITTTEFLTEWLDGDLDLPVLSLPPVRRERILTPAGQGAAAPAPAAGPVPEVVRDPLAQLGTIIGPGTPRTYDWDAVEREVDVTGLPTDYKRLYEEYGPRFAVNGFFVAGPAEIASLHALHTNFLRKWCKDNGRPEDADPGDHYTVYPEPGGLLFCGSTEGRDVLCWDTKNPDPSKWPIVNADYGGPEVFTGTLTELLVAELTGHNGLGMTSSELGDPDEWAWPIWGPHAAP
ncbi:hypothetical protein AB0M44_03335 [Streptosporangium subroseum]|uniref:hypothetical protein n=1 Tax=Streptosporangium subroseum TaxID=106412 RepID=UPI00342916A1